MTYDIYEVCIQTDKLLQHLGQLLCVIKSSAREKSLASSIRTDEVIGRITRLKLLTRSNATFGTFHGHSRPKFQQLHTKSSQMGLSTQMYSKFKPSQSKSQSVLRRCCANLYNLITNGTFQTSI